MGRLVQNRKETKNENINSNFNATLPDKFVDNKWIEIYSGAYLVAVEGKAAASGLNTS